MNMNNKTRRNNDIKSRIITRQADKIESLKRTISDLEIDSKKKDSLINSIDSLKWELNEVVKDLKSKSEEYDKLIDELKEMKAVFNKELFKGRWKLIRLLMK